MKIHQNLLFTFSLLFAAVQFASADDKVRLDELDAYWAEVSRSIREGDFEGYKASCHPKGVLVSGKSQSSYPLTKALEGWKQGIMDTKAGKNTASVTFRFSQRFGDETTAHETGMFLYSSVDADGKASQSYVNFEALLVKEEHWRILMEYQKSTATQEDWKKLKSSK
jgi:hypothetical protein